MVLKDKIVLVTGAGKGIGRAVAVAFSKEGCKVVINSFSDTESANNTLNECNMYTSGNIIIKADISSEEQVKMMFDEVRKQFGNLDILVNNAAIFDEKDSPINIDAFEKVYRINFLGQVLVTKYAMPLMSTGKIIYLSSLHGKLGYGRPAAIAYSAFKAALESYTKNLAKDLAPRVLVNAVAPGRVVTPMWGSLNEKEQEELGQAHLIKRMIKPEEIADGVLFVAKNDAVCGEVLTIDGGMSLVGLDQ